MYIIYPDQFSTTLVVRIFRQIIIIREASSAQLNQPLVFLNLLVVEFRLAISFSSMVFA